MVTLFAMQFFFMHVHHILRKHNNASKHNNSTSDVVIFFVRTYRIVYLQRRILLRDKLAPRRRKESRKTLVTDATDNHLSTMCSTTWKLEAPAIERWAGQENNENVVDCTPVRHPFFRSTVCPSVVEKYRQSKSLISAFCCLERPNASVHHVRLIIFFSSSQLLPV